MTTSAEKIGAALARAVKGTAAKLATSTDGAAKAGTAMYRTNIKDVPKVEGLKRDDGWIDMQVQFLIDKTSAGADHVVGWTVLKPGASHERHLHRNCDEFFIVLTGKGHIYHRARARTVRRRRRGLLPARLLARLQQHLERGRRAGVGLDGRRLDRCVRLPGAAGARMSTADDPRIRRGMTAQFAARRARIAAGERPLGWKVGFGAPASMQKLAIDAPLVGFLMHSARIASGGTASLKGWVKPVAEAEIAVHIGRDLGAGADRATAAAAIAAFSPAIELADVDVPPEDVAAILAGNIFQRHVVLGRSDTSRAGGDTAGVSGRIFRRGTETARTDQPEAATGNLVDIVRHVVDLLAAFGEGLKAGDVIMTGSITPPIFIEPDEDAIAFELDPIGGVSVQFRH